MKHVAVNRASLEQAFYSEKPETATRFDHMCKQIGLEPAPMKWAVLDYNTMSEAWAECIGKFGREFTLEDFMGALGMETK